jgi:hypothetical protein
MKGYQFKYIRKSSLFFSLLFLVLIASASVFAQATQTGRWKAEVSDKNPEKIQISFYCESAETNGKGKNRNQISGRGFELNELQGLSAGQINGSNSNVAFSIAREAGTINLNGTFNAGEGSGTFVFTPNPAFLAAMRGSGFENISDDQLFASAVLDVRSQTVAELRSSGLKIQDFDDVFKATIFKIDANYIREMSTAGFNDLDMEDLVKTKIFKIDANYAREILAMGFGQKDIEELVKFRIFKITPEFLAQMKAEGLSELSAEDLVQLRIFKIDGSFIQSVRAQGYPNPTVEELVELKIHGKVK